MLTLSHTADISGPCHRRLDAFLHQQRVLWNAALEERIGAYRKAGKSITFYDQCKGLTEIRQDDSDFSQYSVGSQRSVLNKLDKAFKGFFSRVRRGGKPGFPRFRGRNRALRSFDVPNPVLHRCGKYHVLIVKGIGRFRFRYRTGMEHLPVKAARIVRTPCRVCVQRIVESPVIRDRGQEPLGADVGITNRVVLSTSDRYARRSRPTQRLKRLQRSLSRKVKGSNGRMKARALVAKEHQRIALSERNATHRMTTALVRPGSNKFYVEDLNIQGMVKNRSLARSIHEQSWATLVSQLTYKAENAGGWVHGVAPRNTSQVCSECGCSPCRKLTLADRVYRCGQCGYESDRDVNAARNILLVGLTGQPGGNAPAYGGDEKYGGPVRTPHRAEQHAVNLSSVWLKTPIFKQRGLGFCGISVFACRVGGNRNGFSPVFKVGQGSGRGIFTAGAQVPVPAPGRAGFPDCGKGRQAARLSRCSFSHS